MVERRKNDVVIRQLSDKASEYANDILSIKSKIEVIEQIVDDTDVDVIASKVAERVIDSLSINHKQHASDHAWIKRQRDKQNEYSELRQKIITSACRWSIPLILTFVISSFWNEISRLIKQ